MVRVVLGTGLEEQTVIDVHAVTLGEALSQVEERFAWLPNAEPRVFVDGVDAERLEGPRTPVGDEDTVLLTTY